MLKGTAELGRCRFLDKFVRRQKRGLTVLFLSTTVVVGVGNTYWTLKRNWAVDSIYGKLFLWVLK